MKISVSTYSFGSYADKSKLGITGVMDKALEMGFEGIELVECEELYDPATIKEIKDHSEAIGIPIVALDVGADFTKDNCFIICKKKRKLKWK